MALYWLNCKHLSVSRLNLGKAKPTVMDPHTAQPPHGHDVFASSCSSQTVGVSIVSFSDCKLAIIILAWLTKLHLELAMFCILDSRATAKININTKL